MDFEILHNSQHLLLGGGTGDYIMVMFATKEQL